jgi:AcrR family transcriptional regulator
MAAMAAGAGVSVRTLYRLFGDRATLLHALDLAPSPPTRVRILEVALDLVGQRGLADFSMDELADAAGVSRATLYRLVPGKSALFRELLQTYSPWEPVAQVLEHARGASPSDVTPQVARAVMKALEGRVGVLLRMVVEMARGDPDSIEGIEHAMTRGAPDLVRYLDEQMSAGRLRRVHPVLAIQLLAGPLVAHQLTQPLAALLGFDLSADEVADQVSQAWLRAMAPEVASP